MNKKLMSEFSKWLKSNRAESGLTLIQLKEAINNLCTDAYLSKLENNRYKGKKGNPAKPDIAIVEALAKALNRPLDEARHAAGYARTDSANSINIEGVGSIQFEKGIKFTQKGKEQIEIAIKMAVAMAEKEGEEKAIENGNQRTEKSGNGND